MSVRREWMAVWTEIRQEQGQAVGGLRAALVRLAGWSVLAWWLLGAIWAIWRGTVFGLWVWFAAPLVLAYLVLMGWLIGGITVSVGLSWAERLRERRARRARGEVA